MTAEPVTWVREDHTKAKHDLLRAFFNKWVSIHSEHFTKSGQGLVRIHDGFAGPGIYSGGEPGSPRILLEALMTNERIRDRWHPVRFEFSFVDRDARRVEMLRHQLAGYEQSLRLADRWSDRVSWTVTCGRYEENVPEVVSSPSALFLFLDPFGYSHAPMTLTQNLVQQPKSDTLIFLPLSFVNRFVGRDGQEAALDRFFGTPDWRDIPDGAGRPSALLELFQDQLRVAGLSWCLPFRLRPPDGTNEYWIVGASSHHSGFESIKEGFWTVDPRNGQGFASSPPTLQGQLDLGFEEPVSGPDTSQLLEVLRAKFGADTFGVEDAEDITHSTRFLQAHLRRRTLSPAEQAGTLEVLRPQGVRQFPAGQGIRMRFV